MTLPEHTLTETAVRLLVRVDDRPTMVCIQDIAALVPTEAGETDIVLRSGYVVRTPTLVDDLLDQFDAAQYPDREEEP